MHSIQKLTRGFLPALTRITRLLVLTLGAISASALHGQIPAVGAKAPDFTLNTPSGTPVHLADEESRALVVLVGLRGFPGYQCPYCTRQVHDFVDHSADFSAHHAIVLLVYPGPPAELDKRAVEFMAKQAALPDSIKLVTDPDYTMTNRYGLRWEAPRETAYPSTFLLNRQGVVRFEKISREHGDRTSAVDVLAELDKK